MNQSPLLRSLALAIPVALAASSAHADLALAQKSGCTVCHSVDAAIVGPAYKDVAAKYKGNGAALDQLAAKVKAGGTGNWGQIPMPPNAHVPEEDIKALVTWILGL